jgi:RimJ/RimL family protein N-acetyltransferase
MSVEIAYPREEYYESFHRALDQVARERVYIEMTEAPPLESVRRFQAGLVARDGPVYYALDGAEVVGWCDVFPHENPRHAHRGSLGMGCLPAYRGRGIGARLLEATLAHAGRFGLEKVELHVYTSNTAALRLYEKFGFEREGLLRSYRKLDGVTFDCLVMARFL